MQFCMTFFVDSNHWSEFHMPCLSGHLDFSADCLRACAQRGRSPLNNQHGTLTLPSAPVRGVLFARLRFVAPFDAIG